MHRNLKLIIALLILSHGCTPRDSLRFSGPSNSPFPEAGIHGHLKVGPNGDDTFYWFFPSRGTPETDPLLVWYTGGPGASTMLALLMENGPFLMTSNGTVQINPSSWNTNANLLYIDNPIGTGFSHGKLDDLARTEEDVVAMNLQFFASWFALEPFIQYRGRDMFIAGESYGGHYVPVIGNAIKQSGNPYYQLKGIMVGNGMVKASSQSVAYATYAASMQQYTNFSQAQAEQISPLFVACQNMIMNSPKYLNDKAQAYCGSLTGAVRQGQNYNVYDVTKPCTGQLCYGLTNEINFMNSAAVMDALEADVPWQYVSHAVDDALSRLDYIRDCTPEIAQLIQSDVRVLVYYGELDWICNWMGGYQWSLDFDWPGKQAYAQAQGVDFQGIGQLFFAAEYPNFKFLKFFAAGHLVPMDQPANALLMLSAFINNQV